jgi:hypothetical protein
MDVRLPKLSVEAALAGVWAGALVAVLLSELSEEEPPEHKRAFCSDCALATSGKGCMRRPRLRRGRARRRRRHGGSRCERGPPDDGDGPPPPPARRDDAGRRL